MRKVIYQRSGVTEGVTEVKLPCSMEVGKEFERDAEGDVIHSKNKTPLTEKEKLAGNKKTKSGNIIREVKEDQWVSVGKKN